MTEGDLQAKFEHEVWYHARVESVRFDESGGSNTPGIVIVWEVIDGEMQGKPLVDERWITKNNAQRHVKEFLVLGFDAKKKPLRFMPGDCVGKEADILCRIQEFPKGSGNFTPRVGRVKPPGAGGEEKLIAKLEEIIGNELREQDEWEKDKKF